MYKIINAKVGNPQNSIIKKWAEPTLKSSIFQAYIFKKIFIPMAKE